MKNLALLFATLFAVAVNVPCRAGEESAAPNVALQKAVFSMGCFWCAQDPYDKVKGVASTLVGYTGGKEPNPTYDLVSTGETGYRESIEVTYDPSKVTYDELLDVFWRHINPTQTDGQFSDHDHQYTTAIYYLNEEQKKQAEASKDRLANSGKFSKPIATVILPAMKFWPAEEHHQKYYQKNPEEYEAYHVGSGRVDYLEHTWGAAK